MKHLLAGFFFLFIHCQIWAQGSYMYLEPIKGLPCKVLLNQKEINQMTRNYFLLPLSGEGEYTIDLVFGGNLHPKQTFVVDVVDGAAYGFKLARTAENKFYLLDLVNTGKIVETNSAVNLALTTEDNVIHYYDPQAPALSAGSKDEPRRGSLFRRLKSGAPQQTDTKPAAESASPAEKFGVVQVITSQTEEPGSASRIEKASSRCQSAASDEEVNMFAAKLSQKNDDESKLILIRKKIFTGCLTCRQLLVLTETLNTQYGRFSSVKILRPLMSDPANISQLEPLFRSDSYKVKLREIQ